MSKHRSDAIQALVAELVDADAQVETARGVEDTARQESIAARQTLDLATSQTKDAIARRDTTQQALGLIAGRDELSEDTVNALIERARR